MRGWFITLSLLFGGMSAAQGDDRIAEVLVRSQAIQLERESTVDPDSPSARTVRTSFETVASLLQLDTKVELRMISGATVAETLQGHVVLANQSLAELSEGERLFILAHEFGHIALHHWAQTEQVFQKWVPGAVVPKQTEPIAGLLGRDASALAYRQEFEADAFAMRTLRTLGYPAREATSAFMRLGAVHDTATHPGTSKRLAALRAADAAASAASPRSGGDLE